MLGRYASKETFKNLVDAPTIRGRRAGGGQEEWTTECLKVKDSGRGGRGPNTGRVGMGRESGRG